MDVFHNKREQLLTTASLNIGNMFVGCMAGWTSPVIPKLQDLKQTPLTHTITLTQGSWVGSLFSLGMLCGPIIGGHVSNRFGRKKCALLGALIITIGCIILLLVSSLEMFLIGRFICGMGSGMICFNSIIYIGEIASVSIRGILLTSMGIFQSLGILIINCVGLFSYNCISITVLLISLSNFLSCIFIKESPIFFLIMGKHDKMIKTLERLGRHNEISEITHLNDSYKKKRDYKWQEVFTVKCNRKSFFIGLPLFIFQLCSGALLTTCFTTSIFQLAGSSIKPAIASIITSATMLIGTLTVPPFVETRGRRTLLMISSFGCSLSFAILGTYFYLQKIGSHVIKPLTWVPLAALIFMFISFSFGLNIIPSTILGELFLPNIRSIGCNIVKVLTSLTFFITISSFGYVVENLGSFAVFWIFSIFCAASFLFTAIIVPETKGLTLAEIQSILS